MREHSLHFITGIVLIRATKRGNYRKAFLACRKHRIDLNVIVDRDPDLFRKRLTSFIEQVHDIDYINLFLTNLGSVIFFWTCATGADRVRSEGSQPPEVISELCDAIREQLEAQDIERYINSILTAYVVKRPPDLEAGLSVLLQLRGIVTLSFSAPTFKDASLNRTSTKRD